jgi:hypothetical protein
MSATATEILRDQSAMEQQRFQFDSTNQRIADLIWPAAALFLQNDSTQGQRRDEFQFDSTGALALGRFSAAVESLLTPRTQKWHGLEPRFEELANSHSIKMYCETVTNILFKARYSPRAGFTYASSETYMSLGGFGNGCIFLDDDVGRDLRYRSLYVGEIWVGVDYAGRVDRVHRKFKLTAHQAKTKPEWKDKLPKNIAEAKDEMEFDFLHCVRDNQNYDPGRRDYRGMRYSSYYLACGTAELIQEGGYRTMPYLFSRFSTAPRETYGRGPASMVLNTLNLINEQQKTLLRGGQHAVLPPLMTVDDDALEGFNMKSGALNRGWLDENGNPRVVPFQNGANLPIGQEFVIDSRAVINSAFFVDLFQILLEQPQMTATEALLRAQEKGELLGPTVGRQQSELLSPMIERELDILSNVPGLLPDMPPELQEAGGFMAVKFTSPLDRMQQAGDGAAMNRWLEQMVPLVQVKPEVLNGIDWSRWARKAADIQGVPEDVRLPEDVEAAKNDQDAQMQQAAQLVQAAPLLGKAAADAAKAQQLAQATPSAAGLL